MKSAKPSKPIPRISAKKLASLGGSLPGSTVTGKRSKPKACNAKRRASEFARCYGSKERVEWVKSLPCVGCATYWPIQPSPGWVSENAHTVTGGKGRKADADTIVPLCAAHHRAYDRHRAPFDHDEMRERMKYTAKHVEAAWQRECARRGVPA